MKILWVCNVIVPKICEMEEQENRNCVGGWLEGMSDALLKSDDVTLIYCYPNYESNLLIEEHVSNFYSYGIPMTYKEASKTLK